eukprot:1658648-Rhodomonas_salina.2
MSGTDLAHQATLAMGKMSGTDVARDIGGHLQVPTRYSIAPLVLCVSYAKCGAEVGVLYQVKELMLKLINTKCEPPWLSLRCEGL